MGADLERFVDALFQDTKGYVYSPTKDKSGVWGTHFVDWPGGRSNLLDHILTNGEKRDVYIAPALYREKKASKADVLGSHVAWSESDGSPIDWESGEIPRPSIVVQSSTEHFLHFYWLLEHFTAPAEVEALNRYITYGYDLDIGAWDVTQLLRPPDTYNFKVGKNQPPVILRELDAGRLYAYPSIPVPKLTASDVPVPPTIPSLMEVISHASFSEAAKKAMAKDASDISDRSEHMFHVACLLHESGLTHEQILTMMLELDNRFGKFSKRMDQMDQLNKLVYTATQQPKAISIVEVNTAKFSGAITRTAKAFLAEKFVFEKVYDFIYPNAISLIVGAPGAGKTSQSLHEALSITASTDRRIVYFEMEMAEPNFWEFVGNISPKVPEAKMENLLIHCPGVGISIDEIEYVIKAHNPDGVYIDSLSSMLTKFDEESSLKFLNWLMKFTSDNHFAVVVHHRRKVDPKDDPTIDDTYGSVFIAAKAAVIRELKGGVWHITKDRHSSHKDKTYIAESPFMSKEANETNSTDSGPDGSPDSEPFGI